MIYRRRERLRREQVVPAPRSRRGTHSQSPRSPPPAGCAAGLRLRFGLGGSTPAPAPGSACQDPGSPGRSVRRYPWPACRKPARRQGWTGPASALTAALTTRVASCPARTSKTPKSMLESSGVRQRRSGQGRRTGHRSASPGRPGECGPVPAVGARYRRSRRNRAGRHNRGKRPPSVGPSPPPRSPARLPARPGRPGPARTSSAAAAAHGAPWPQPSCPPPDPGPACSLPHRAGSARWPATSATSC